MNFRIRRNSTYLSFFLLFLVVHPSAAGPTSIAFRITFDRKVSEVPFTGRVFVMLSKELAKEPPSGPNWFNPLPFFAKDVKDWKPGEGILFDADTHLFYPEPLAKVSTGLYYAQAIMDFDRGGQSFSAAEGNGYSNAVRFDRGISSEPVSLHVSHVFHERPFMETDRVKLVDTESKLLSSFHGRSVNMRAAVILPKSYWQDPSKRYPVIYAIPGFGGTHYVALRDSRMAHDLTEVAGVEMVYVVLDPRCRLGHHVFADSDNNGPWGKALVEELVPYIERQFRGIGEPAARFVTGHSSGGWSSLWLQITYADFFGGVWSTSPDPVDFRDFQRIDLTKSGVNLFVDSDGKDRPLARMNKKAVLFFKPFSDMEAVMGHGGQLSSFEAVFSPRGQNGKPQQLWNRATGEVDSEVARAWEKYDIRLQLERNWKSLGPKLSGKIHVYTGGEDTFYLEGAVVLLKESLKKLGSDAVIEIVPDKDHANLLSTKMRERIAREMADQYERLQAQANKPSSPD
jgi:S-formylglutathione hydrolase FrmB